MHRLLQHGFHVMRHHHFALFVVLFKTEGIEVGEGTQKRLGIVAPPFMVELTVLESLAGDGLHHDGFFAAEGFQASWGDQTKALQGVGHLEGQKQGQLTTHAVAHDMQLVQTPIADELR